MMEVFDNYDVRIIWNISRIMIENSNIIGKEFVSIQVPQD